MSAVSQYLKTSKFRVSNIKLVSRFEHDSKIPIFSE